MLRKRRSPKRRPSLQLVSDLIVPAALLDWEWDLLAPLLAMPSKTASAGAPESLQPAVDDEAR
jgi:hypothetical protein